MAETVAAKAVDTRCAESAGLLEDWSLIRALQGGTKAMRAAGRKYLPKFAADTDDAYRIKLARATLHNVFDESIKNVVSKPFSKPITFSKDTDPAIVEWSVDVDRMGSSISSWSWNPFKDGLAMGSTAIFVDYPTTVAGETAADEKARNPKPYLVAIKVENILACNVRGGREGPEVTLARFLECTTEPDPNDEYGEITVERVRVLTPGRFEVYRKKEGKTKGAASLADEWVLESEGTTPLDFVPFYLFFTGEKCGDFTARPPFLDLAYKNVEHYQSASDQRHILTVSRFAMLYVKGDGAESVKDGLQIGPMQVMKGEWGILEPTGNAIEQGWKDLTKLEDDMRVMGLQPMIRRSQGAVTATERTLDSVEVHTQAQKFALDFGAVLERVCKAAAAWIGVKDAKVSIAINTDYGLAAQSAQEIDSLIKIRAAREISRSAFIDALVRRDLLPGNFDAAADQAAIDEEAPDDLRAPANDPGAVDDTAPAQG